MLKVDGLPHRGKMLSYRPAGWQDRAGFRLAVYCGRDSMDEGHKKFLVLIPVVFALVAAASCVFAQAVEQSSAPAAETIEPQQRPKLNTATMCERVDNLLPTRPGIVFSVSNGQVCCFTSFDPVPQPALIYHRWYHRDELSTQTRLQIVSAQVGHIQCDPAPGNRQRPLEGRGHRSERPCFQCPAVQHYRLGLSHLRDFMP